MSAWKHVIQIQETDILVNENYISSHHQPPPNHSPFPSDSYDANFYITFQKYSRHILTYMHIYILFPLHIWFKKYQLAHCFFFFFWLKPRFFFF